MKTNFLRQVIIDKILSLNQNSIYKKFFFKLLVNINSSLGNEDDLIKYNLNGKEVLLLSSHELPVLRKLIPQYSENIGRIAQYVKNKYDDLKVIDIGANVGDTVYIIKSYSDVPILCIEGNPKYFSLLRENIKHWNDVRIESTFIGNADFGNAEYIFSKGSGQIVKSNSSDSDIVFNKLSSVLEHNKQFSDFKLIKIDTDGFDCKIIRNEIELFSNVKPVIFFEYDPYLLINADDDGLSVFPLLRDAGYDKVIFYENSGDYLLTTSLGEIKIIEDLHNYYSGRQKEKYCDLCVFHKDDSELVEQIREKEIDFFRLYRS